MHIPPALQPQEQPILNTNTTLTSPEPHNKTLLLTEQVLVPPIRPEQVLAPLPPPLLPVTPHMPNEPPFHTSDNATSSFYSSFNTPQQLISSDAPVPGWFHIDIQRCHMTPHTGDINTLVHAVDYHSSTVHDYYT